MKKNIILNSEILRVLSWKSKSIYMQEKENRNYYLNILGDIYYQFF